MNKILSLLIVLLLSSCVNSQQTEDCTSLSRVKNYKIDCSLWERFYQGINGPNEELFEYRYESSDTLKKLFIEIKHEDDADRIIIGHPTSSDLVFTRSEKEES